MTRDLPTIKGRRPGIHTLPPRTDYVYRGTQPFVPPKNPAPVVPRKRVAPASDARFKPFDPSACGTPKGFWRHEKRGIDACEPCKVAIRAYQRERHSERRRAK